MNPSQHELTTLPHRDLLHEKIVFVSASFPSRERSARFYETADPNEITQALVATLRAVLSAGGRIVFGGHPSVTPLVMMVAEEYLPESIEDRLTLRESGRSAVIAYQSESFRAAMPESTRNLEAWGLGELRWVEVQGDEPQFTPDGTLIHGTGEQSLRRMRAQMFGETRPVAAIFIGGMEGIHNEAELFRQMCRGQMLYFLGAPGGAARELAQNERSEFTPEAGLNSDELLKARSYPAIAQRIVMDIAARS